MSQQFQFDALIIGSGAAGLALALHLNQCCKNIKIAVLSKKSLEVGSTYYAQGGIAAVTQSTDSIESHVSDTLKAGSGLCHEDIVEHTLSQGESVINWLIEQGVPFTQQKDSSGKSDFHLTQEGGHTKRRIFHADDATGQAIFNALMQQVKKSSQIHLFENYLAVDLITGKKLGLNKRDCFGAYALNLTNDTVDTIQAKCTVLATGGASKVYLYTSNPDVATGDGIAMAWRAGARVANLEFNQFHPTCLYHPHAKTFLITEAMRGEGAKLLLPNGEEFIQEFDSRAELAPRDIVARAIDHQMKRFGFDHVFLDISHKKANWVQSHFPQIYQQCLKYDIDITKSPIPVVPAAHYTCGGVITNRNGQTDIPNLYAVGETTFTGLHGANRMASNSLLECFVFARAAAHHIHTLLPSINMPKLTPSWDESQVTDSDEDVVISHNWHELRRFMWDYVGIVRTNKRLERAQHRIDVLNREIAEYYSNYKISNDLIELRNLALVAELMIKSALQRKESRGLHYSLDYPYELPTATDTILTPPDS